MARGILIVNSGPSGVGKGTIDKILREQRKKLVYSISVTSRKPRQGEHHGVEYFFHSVEEIKDMIAKDELLEYADVFGNYYGTPKKYVEEQLEKGNDVLLEIDVKGGLQVKKRMPEAVLIFIAPPDMKELERRLRNRGTETPEAIERRLIDSRWEMVQQDKYDYVVVNNTVDQAVADCLKIIDSVKEKRK